MPNSWFGGKRTGYSKRSLQEKIESIPEGLWTPCPKCRQLLFTRELEKNLKVCQKCDYHFRLTAHERIAMLLDPDSFVERDASLRTTDPLQFPNYDETLARYQNATGLSEAVVSGEGRVNGLPLSIAVTDSYFLMGSMATVVGERITRAIERSIEREIPVLLVSGSGGGARMHEGLLSLMQMAKTAGALARLQQAGLLAVVLLTDPSMAGVMASWGSLGDVILAEPGAQIGFTGQRVSKQAQVTKAPADFQTAEFQLKHGMIDRVVPRRELKETIGKLLLFGGAVAEVKTREPLHAR